MDDLMVWIWLYYELVQLFWCWKFSGRPAGRPAFLGRPAVRPWGRSPAAGRPAGREAGRPESLPAGRPAALFDFPRPAGRPACQKSGRRSTLLTGVPADPGPGVPETNGDYYNRHCRRSYFRWDLLTGSRQILDQEFLKQMETIITGIAAAHISVGISWRGLGRSWTRSSWNKWRLL